MYDAGNRGNSEKWCTSWWNQFKILLIRGLRERRFEAFNKLRIFQVVSMAILGGLLWWQTPAAHIDDRVSIPTKNIMIDKSSYTYIIQANILKNCGSFGHQNLDRHSLSSRNHN